jgi:hypothetical protein
VYPKGSFDIKSQRQNIGYLRPTAFDKYHS